MSEIKKFIDNLPYPKALDLLGVNSDGEFNNKTGHEGVVTMSTFKNKKNGNTEDILKITVTKIDFIRKVFIPLLDSLIWRSKKEKDYQD